MGSSSSFLGSSNDLNDLISYVTNDDIRSFKQGIKSVTSPQDINVLVFETACEKKTEFLNLVINRLDTLLSHNSSNERYRECMLNALRYCSRPYFNFKQTEMHINNLQLLLECAILSNSYDSVCLLLYYMTDVSIKKDITPFMYSLLCESSENIQKTLIEYEADFNQSVRDGMSTLFMTIKFRSPLALEVIKRGGDVNYHTDDCNAVCLALTYICDPKVFRLIWEKFDYEIWKRSFSKSVLLRLIENDMPSAIWKGYVYILMENENKLRLDLEHHRNSYFFKSDLLICNFYLRCLRTGIESDTADSFVLHLLSHGADIFTEDIDIIYNKLCVSTPLLNTLLYMDICYNRDKNYNSFMYFKYYPVPDLNSFMMNIATSLDFSEILSHTIKTLKNYCAIGKELQMILRVFLGYDESAYKCYQEIIKISTTVPSLLELSRDSARKAICNKYRIKNSCKLHTIIRSLGLPKFVEGILLYNIPIYFTENEEHVNDRIKVKSTTRRMSSDSESSGDISDEPFRVRMRRCY